MTDNLRVQTANLMLLGGLMILTSIYVAYMALSKADIAYMLGALASALILGFCTGALATNDACTVSLDTMNACRVLASTCQVHKERLDADQKIAQKRIVHYA